MNKIVRFLWSFVPAPGKMLWFWREAFHFYPDRSRAIIISILSIIVFPVAIFTYSINQYGSYCSTLPLLQSCSDAFPMYLAFDLIFAIGGTGILIHEINNIWFPAFWNWFDRWEMAHRSKSGLKKGMEYN